MKKFFAVLSLMAIVAVVAGCTEKRCACTTVRGNHEYESHSLESLDGHGDCSELNAEWISTMDSATMLMKECVPEGN